MYYYIGEDTTDLGTHIWSVNSGGNPTGGASAGTHEHRIAINPNGIDAFGGGWEGILSLQMYSDPADSGTDLGKGFSIRINDSSAGLITPLSSNFPSATGSYTWTYTALHSALPAFTNCDPGHNHYNGDIRVYGTSDSTIDYNLNGGVCHPRESFCPADVSGLSDTYSPVGYSVGDSTKGVIHNLTQNRWEIYDGSSILGYTNTPAQSAFCPIDSNVTWSGSISVIPC